MRVLELISVAGNAQQLNIGRMTVAFVRVHMMRVQKSSIVWMREVKTTLSIFALVSSLGLDRLSNAVEMNTVDVRWGMNVIKSRRCPHTRPLELFKKRL